LGLIPVHYLWVVNTAIAFEDASVEHAQKRGARIAAWRSGGQRLSAAPSKARGAPFRLSGFGRPEMAFLWKNLLSTWPYFTPRVFAVCAFVAVAGCAWLNSQPAWRVFLPAIGMVTMFFATYVLIIGL